MKLAFALTFEALCSDEGPEHLERLFAERFGPTEDNPDPEVLIGRARHCETLISELFGLDEALARYRQRDADFALLQTLKYKFVKRKGILGSDPAQLAFYDPAPAQALWRRLSIADDQDHFDELAFARTVGQWQATGPDDETADEAARGLQMAARYSAWACLTQAGRHLHRGQVLFNHAQGVDPETLLHGLETAQAPESQRRIIRIQPVLREPRPGFDLTDAGPSPAHGLDQARYCLICHPTQSDSCSHGLKRKDGNKEPTAFAHNALGVELGGCPLGERISEFQSLRREGRPIAALAMIMRDNPMVAATGHRICNDCSRACVFQQQTPVDIPGGETRVLEDVLALPWGVEIYSLLTRWNPLRPPQGRCRGDSGRKVLVVGLGPAGFTLAHHLLNQGHQVVAIDGQKIEPLADELLNQPVESWAQFQESLAERTPTGFGGVTEYGITVRWNKNYLKLIRLTLERRSRFRMMGGVRLGAQLRLDDAFALGFDHVALALGAGKPRLWDIPAALPRGVRMASDFLMALQLGGLSREDSLSSLQIELPLAVIGAGLTAVDTATEALAWYALQVERFARRHALLVADPATAKYLDALPAAERQRAERFIEHGQAIQAAKELATLEAGAAAQRAPETATQSGSRATTPAHDGADRRVALRIRDLLQSWGGVTLVYRAPLRNSPAYRLNHDELQKALAEGIQVLENSVVSDVRTDDSGSLQALQLTTADTPEAPAQWLPVRSALLAVGTGHSTFTDRASDTAQHAAIAGDAVRSGSIQTLRDEKFLAGNDPRVTCFGDMHASYSGSVVRAMASAARGALLLDGLLGRAQARDTRSTTISFNAFADTLAGQWQARLCSNEILAKGIYELAIDAPAAASQFQPGQFFRLQDFEASSPRATEPMAMTGAEVTAGENSPKERLRTIILQSGTSTALASRWAPGRPLILMGPCGEPSEIPSGQKVLLVGGGLGNAVLFSIGQACRAKQCDVTYIAGYRSAADVFRRDALEAAADRILWCFEQSGAPETQFKSHIRPQDQMFAGNVLQAMRHLSTQQAGKGPALADIGHLLVIGSDAMMAALASACKDEFAPFLQPGLKALASVNAPMQCMMKGICGQCLQAVTDPVTGVVRHVFACEQQDQPLRDVDFAQLHARLQQNRVLETQNSAWLARHTRS